MSCKHLFLCSYISKCVAKSLIPWYLSVNSINLLLDKSWAIITLVSWFSYTNGNMQVLKQGWIKACAFIPSGNLLTVLQCKIKSDYRRHSYRAIFRSQHNNAIELMYKCCIHGHTKKRSWISFMGSYYNFYRKWNILW